MDKRSRELYRLLLGEYQTAKVLADKLGVSMKTVRTLVKELDRQLLGNGAYVVSKHGTGYKIIVDDQQKLDHYFDLLDERSFSNTRFPSNSEERIRYLLEFLLNYKNYIKMDDLCESLYISRKILYNDLKKVEALLNEHNLELIRRPKYGIKVIGTEFDSRMCLASYTVKEVYGKAGEKLKKDEALYTLGEWVSKCLMEEDFSISNVALQNLVVHLYIAILRIKDGHYVFMEDGHRKETAKNREYMVAGRLVDGLNVMFDVEFPESEIHYIAIHLAGKRMNDNDALAGSTENLVIGPEISNIVTEMLQVVYDAFRFDFRDDLELRMSLSQHIMPLTVRIQYDMNLRNPLLRDVKERFSLAYAMAAAACMVINRHYGKNLKEDEVGYIALAFALALERQRTEIAKKNILLVCASGKGSAQLLRYKYMKEFGNYINHIETCDVSGIHRVDFKGIDYVFTTVPIHVKVPVPIREVEYFLEDNDITAMKKMLSQGLTNSIEHHYRRDLFFPHLKYETKDEALKHLCGCMIETLKLPKEFHDSVLERERLAKTEFGNRVAMPHPYTAMGGETIVCVGILDQPLYWAETEVEVIFLISFEKHGKDDLEKFYQITAGLLISQEYIGELIEKRDYGVLMGLLNRVEKELEEEG